MDAAACRVVYIDDRFGSERWLSRGASSETRDLPPDLQANVNAILSVFNQVYASTSGRTFSSKLSELHEIVKHDCTPIIACFDVGSETRHRPRAGPVGDSPTTPSPASLRRQITFSSESDESYGLQLLSRIAADLQVEEGTKLIIPVAIVQPKRRDSHAPDDSILATGVIDPQMMLNCLEAGALDVVQSPLDKAGILGLTVHAFRIYKTAKKEQAGFLAQARGRRKQSWVGVEEEEKPYAYMREAMVKKLLKGICEPETVIEDYQHRELHVEDHRKEVIAREVGKWSFCGHDFSEDELVYAGYLMLEHALQMAELQQWRISQDQLLRFMQGCRVAYNSFVLYHNFRHAVDVLQSLFYFIVEIGIIPPYPNGSTPPQYSHDKSPIAKLLQPFDALTLLVSAIGHDVGHPGVNNMFLVKLNAPLAQLYNDQSVLEAFHCAAYSQILRRHWPSAFHDKAIRKLMISSILATDMGVHSDYMQQLGQLQEKIHESKTTDGWSVKDLEQYKVLTCGLLIKCADISNVARPWAVAEKWTHLLQLEFAHQGEMEQAVGMETVLFGGPPELGNILKLANSQIGFMGIFAHPLFQNVADIIPAMGFAGAEILINKGVWFTKAEQEKRKEQFRRDNDLAESGAVSPRSLSPTAPNRKRLHQHLGDDKEAISYFPASPLRHNAEPSPRGGSRRSSRGNVEHMQTGHEAHHDQSRRSSLGGQLAGSPTASRRSSGALSPGEKTNLKPRPPRSKERQSSNSLSSGQHRLGDDAVPPFASTKQGDSENEAHAIVSGAGPSLPQNDGTGDIDSNVNTSGTSLEGTAPPLEEDSQLHHRVGNHFSPTLHPFTFATSKPNEPIRTVNPSSYSQITTNAHHASEPSIANANFDRTSMATSGGAASSTTDVDRRTTMAALSPSTEATSFLSRDSEDQHQQEMDSDQEAARLEFEARRARATSLPAKTPLSLTGTRSRESTKQNIQTVVLGQDAVNGDVSTRSGTMPRRRSRLRLAFWRKRSDNEDC